MTLKDFAGPSAQPADRSAGRGAGGLPARAADRDRGYGVPIPRGRQPGVLLAGPGRGPQHRHRGHPRFRWRAPRRSVRRSRAERGMPVRRLRRGDRTVRRRLLPHLAGRGGTPGPAAAHDAGGELAGPRGRRHRPGPAERDQNRCLHRDQQRRVPDDGRGLAQAQRGGRMPLRPQRHQPERRQRAGLLRPGTDGAGQGGGRGLRVVPGGGARRGGGPPAGQGGSGHRGRRPGHPQHPDLRAEGGRDDAVPRRAVQDVRRLRQRLRAGRGLRRGRPETAERGGGRRRPGLGGHPGCGC